MNQAVSDIVAPGKLADICGIRTAITENHNENFYFWQKSGIKNATLLHVDAHSDMFGPAPFLAKRIEGLPENYYDEVDIAQFICPSFHYGIISSIYWNDPHEILGRRFVDLGARDEPGRRKLETYVEGGYIFWSKDYLGKHASESEDYIMPQQMNLETGFILDVDLDGFCCINMPDGSDGINGYEKRIRETCAVLRGLVKPGMITITRSQGLRSIGIIGRCVPAELVDSVQEKFIEEFRKAYAA